MFTDETVKKGTKNILLKILPINAATDIIGNFPNLIMQGIALLSANHALFSLL